MPSKTSTSFTNYDRQMKIPFIIYVHIEALQVVKPRSKTIIHKPCGFGYSLKCWYDDSLSRYVEYQGEDCIKVLWEKLEDEAYFIEDKLRLKAEPRVLNDEEKRIVGKIPNCYFCGKILESDRYEDFHPLTGEFLGAAHEECKNKPKFPKSIPVVMHNLKKYGSHFLLHELDDDEMLKIFFPGNDRGGKFGFSRSYQKTSLKFLDSKLFLDETIEELENILSDSKKKKVKKEFRKPEEFNLMKKKNYFPHCYVDSFGKFLEEKLPPKTAFFDRLHDEDISEEAYQRIKDIWTIFNCEKISDYFSLYLKSSVFILEDIFESFRTLCLDKYSLDPAHYYTIASFAWDAMLKFTKVELELLQDKSMVSFIKSSIRGGLLQCSKRHAKANNKYCPDFDKSKPSSFIVYLDANNLGGWAMSQKLPFSNFRWLNDTEKKEINSKILDLPEDGEFGFILEVDLDYPKKLHKLHNDLAFCSQPLEVPPPPVSPKIAAVKPVLNLYDKKNYVIHLSTLKQCLSKGLVLKKIHRVLTFKQCKWLEPYVMYNTSLRTNSKNDFETKFYKLLNNSVYGKSIEKLTNDKPICSGFTILEMSKKFMYHFHYDVMLQKYNKINLLYIDTDGAIYEIQTKDFFGDIKSDPDFLNLLDTSNLDNRWNIPSKNKKVLGKMKDEYGGKIIREFFGAGSKAYFLDVEGEEVKKCSSMKTYVKKKYINKDDYKNCVIKNSFIRRTFMETTTEGHKVQTKSISRNVLSPGDRKRCILENRVDTLSWGFQL